MASTYSALKVELIATGEQVGDWGNTTNVNLGTALEEAIVGRVAVNFDTDADLTISLTNTNATQAARNFILNLTSSGSLTATRSLTVPTISKPYLIENNTTGGRSILVKTAAGTGITVPNGSRALVYANSTDVVAAFSYVPTIIADSVTDTALTATRIPYASTGGLLVDSTNLTFNGTTVSTGGVTATGAVSSATVTASGLITGGSITDSALTSGRVTYATTAGLLTDSANLTFDGTTLTTTAINTASLTGSGLTATRVPYATTGGLITDSPNLTFSGTVLTAAGFAGPLNGTVGATTATTGLFTTIGATGDGTFSGTGQVKMPAGNTAQRSGAPSNGMFRYNSDLVAFEGYVGGIWSGVGGAQANGVIFENSLVITENYTLTTGKNGFSVGPITIDSGVTVTIPVDQRWVVL